MIFLGVRKNHETKKIEKCFKCVRCGAEQFEEMEDRYASKLP